MHVPIFFFENAWIPILFYCFWLYCTSPLFNPKVSKLCHCRYIQCIWSSVLSCYCVLINNRNIPFYLLFSFSVSHCSTLCSTLPPQDREIYFCCFSTLICLHLNLVYFPFTFFLILVFCNMDQETSAFTSNSGIIAFLGMFYSERSHSSQLYFSEPMGQ